MNKLMRPVLAVLTGISAFALGIADGNALSLVPIAQDFAPVGRGAAPIFRLENETDKQVAVTVKVATREVSLDGEETNAGTGDFLVFPSQVVIGPRQSQVVRVQWKGTANPDRELAYRIIAEQMPIKGELGPKARAIQIVVRYVGSLYVLPSGARPDVIVESSRAVMDAQNKRALELVLHNRGRSHTLIDEPVLTLAAGGARRTLKEGDLKEILGENILAGSKRRFFISWPQDLPFEQPTVEFRYSPLR